MILHNLSLKDYNTFKIDILAPKGLFIDSVVDLGANLKELAKEHNFFTLGGGSNILFTKDVEELVLLNNIEYINVQEDDKSFKVNVGAGVNWHKLVCELVDSNIYGLENLALIPGKVGASPIQNIGAYGREVKDFITNVLFIDFDSFQVNKLSNEECKFGYRDSIFKNELKGKFFITEVEFQFPKNNQLVTSYPDIVGYMEINKINNPNPMDVFNSVVEARTRKLPNPDKLPNSGSFFKNPVINDIHIEKIKHSYQDLKSFPERNGFSKISAAWLIEKSGLKGYRVGDAGVSPNHALVLVNYGNATGSQIYELSSHIIEIVNEIFQIKLEREVNIY